MTYRARFIPILITLLSLTACGGGNSSFQSTPTEPTRSFHMGFTPFPPNFSDNPDTLTQIVDEVYNKLATNADLVAHHFDNGIPWNDALTDNYPYKDNIINDWQLRLDKTPVNHKKYISVTPIDFNRSGLALLRDTADDMPLQTPFNTHASTGDFSHNDIKTAYLNYCLRIIAFFNPDYFAIGIESNLLRKNTDAATWQKYLELNQYVYSELKSAHPNLPVFVSVAPLEAIEGYVGPSNEFTGDSAGYAASQASAINDIINNSDYYAIAVYPFMSNFFNSTLPSDFLDRIFALQTKPIAIAETGMLAESTTLFSTTFISDEQTQADYVSNMLSKSDEHDLVFINWFIQQDYDGLCNYYGGCTDLQGLWRDTGLYDGFGNARASLTTWQTYLAYKTR